MGRNTGNNKREKGKETAFHCLVLEDDEKCAEYLGEIIGMEGGSFRICPDLASAWSAVERERFDLMLLDQSLPDGSGSDFFREMCDRGHEAIAIMMTGDLDLPAVLSLREDCSPASGERCRKRVSFLWGKGLEPAWPAA